MKFAKLGIAILLISRLAIAASPQQNPSSGQSASAGQQESVADAARRAKVQKKEEPKPTKVWDNDDIPTISGTISVVGQPSETSAAESSEAPKAEKRPGASLTPEEKADLQSKLDDAKAQLAGLKTDLDIVQRTYTLDEQSFLSNPDHDRDKAGAKALQDEKQQIADKQQDIADAQKKVDDLQAQLAAASDGQSK
jgi:hypothetical protein